MCDIPERFKRARENVSEELQPVLSAIETMPLDRVMDFVRSVHERTEGSFSIEEVTKEIGTAVAQEVEVEFELTSMGYFRDVVSERLKESPRLLDDLNYYTGDWRWLDGDEYDARQDAFDRLDEAITTAKESVVDVRHTLDEESYWPSDPDNGYWRIDLRGHAFNPPTSPARTRFFNVLFKHRMASGRGYHVCYTLDHDNTIQTNHHLVTRRDDEDWGPSLHHPFSGDTPPPEQIGEAIVASERFRRRMEELAE